MTYRNKFKCVHPDDYVIWGDFNSLKAQQFAVKFKMCEGSGCESESDIREWLKNKYIVLLYNHVRFD